MSREYLIFNSKFVSDLTEPKRVEVSVCLSQTHVNTSLFDKACKYLSQTFLVSQSSLICATIIPCIF